jgi:hypothetical protein
MRIVATARTGEDTERRIRWAVQDRKVLQRLRQQLINQWGRTE